MIKSVIFVISGSVLLIVLFFGLLLPSPKTERMFRVVKEQLKETAEAGFIDEAHFFHLEPLIGENGVTLHKRMIVQYGDNRALVSYYIRSIQVFSASMFLHEIIEYQIITRYPKFKTYRGHLNFLSVTREEGRPLHSETIHAGDFSILFTIDRYMGKLENGLVVPVTTVRLLFDEKYRHLTVADRWKYIWSGPYGDQLMLVRRENDGRLVLPMQTKKELF